MRMMSRVFVSIVSPDALDWCPGGGGQALAVDYTGGTAGRTGLLLCCGPWSTLESSCLRGACGPRPDGGLPSSRGSGCEPWVCAPALAFYPGTRGSRGPRTFC